MRTRLLATLTALAVLAGLSLAAAPAASAQPYCGITWGSQPRTFGPGGYGPNASLNLVRAGRHDCYDRLVIETSSPLRQWSVRYVDPASVDTGDAPSSPLVGGAVLEIVTGTWLGFAYPPLRGDQVVPVPVYRTFRSVIAGYRGETDMSTWLGVRARLPFRAFMLPGPGTGGRLVIDVAHQWCATGTTC